MADCRVLALLAFVRYLAWYGRCRYCECHATGSSLIGVAAVVGVPPRSGSLNCENIYITPDRIVKIGGLGSVLPRVRNPQSIQPPELLRNPTALLSRTQKFKVDVYNFSMVMWQVFTRKRPHMAVKEDTLIGRVLGGYRPDLPPSLPPVVRSLLPLCWSAEPTKRPAFDRIASKLSDALAEIDASVSALVKRGRMATDMHKNE